METKLEKLENIHSSMLNGQRKAAVELIDEFGLYDFFAEYLHYLEVLYYDSLAISDYFKDAVVSYNRIKNR